MDKRRVRRELKASRDLGHATDYNECDVGTCGIAAAFTVGKLNVAVSINGATVYFENGRLTELGGSVVKMARELEEAAAKLMLVES